MVFYEEYAIQFYIPKLFVDRMKSNFTTVALEGYAPILSVTDFCEENVIHCYDCSQGHAAS